MILAACMLLSTVADGGGAPERNSQPLSVRMVPASEAASGESEYVIEQGGIPLTEQALANAGLESVDPRVHRLGLWVDTGALLACTVPQLLLWPCLLSLGSELLAVVGSVVLGACTSLNASESRAYRVDMLVSLGYGVVCCCAPAGCAGFLGGSACALVGSFPSWLVWWRQMERRAVHPYVRFVQEWNEDLARTPPPSQDRHGADARVRPKSAN